MSKSSACVLSGAILQGLTLMSLPSALSSSITTEASLLILVVAFIAWITSMVLIVGGCRGKDDWDS